MNMDTDFVIVFHEHIQYLHISHIQHFSFICKAQDAIMDIVRHTLSPELLNRIDETVVFNRLQREHMDKIARKFHPYNTNDFEILRSQIIY